VDCGRLSHLDCTRPRTLTPDERHLLFVYCSDHVVVQCLACGLSLRMMELGTDPFGSRTNTCPLCRNDLTENVRAHLYGCPVLPVEIKLKAQAVREASQNLIKQKQLVDKTDIRLGEVEAAPAAARQALRASMSKRGQG